MAKMKLDKLKNLIGTTIYWENSILNLKEIKNILPNVKTIDKIYYELIPQSKEWHVGRIKYFIENPDKISPIEISDLIYDKIIDDGNHRYIACLILNHEYIEFYFNGSEDTYEYLINR